MNHIFHQTGLWIEPNGTEYEGYSGHGDGMGNPDMQNVRNVGPIPRGTWRIGKAVEGTHMGPLAIHLIWVCGEPGAPEIPRDLNSFYVHGDNHLMNHSASEGCIILPHTARVRLVECEGELLDVVR